MEPGAVPCDVSLDDHVLQARLEHHQYVVQSTGNIDFLKRLAIHVGIILHCGNDSKNPSFL
jgi:hypothetical protein